jgi:hypothetical protein
MTKFLAIDTKQSKGKSRLKKCWESDSSLTSALPTLSPSIHMSLSSPLGFHRDRSIDFLSSKSPSGYSSSVTSKNSLSDHWIISQWEWDHPSIWAKRATATLSNRNRVLRKAITQIPTFIEYFVLTLCNKSSDRFHCASNRRFSRQNNLDEAEESDGAIKETAKSAG